MALTLAAALSRTNRNERRRSYQNHRFGLKKPQVSGTSLAMFVSELPITPAEDTKMARIGTSLTAIETSDATVEGLRIVAGRTSSVFAAQLLAMHLDSPSYRQKRRIEPALGIAAYRSEPRQTTSATRGISA